MKNIIELLAEKPNFYHLNGAQDEMIQKAEELLGLQFAREYVDYVTEYGAVSFGSHELTGVCDSKRLNVVEATFREREYDESYPLNMYLVETTGMEDITIWQSEDGKIYQLSYHKTPLLIADSLYQYIEEH